MENTLQNQLQFIIEADKMKSIFRQTMVLDKTKFENNAEHSWHFALAAMTLVEYAGFDGVDINHVVKMAILHDLVEIYAGDTPAFDISGNTDKDIREKEAADKVFSLLPPMQAAEYRSLWEEFDAMETPSARYAAAIDRILPFMSNHLVDGHSWQKYNVTKAQVLGRMAIVETAIPSLWPFVISAVEQGCKDGYIKL